METNLLVKDFLKDIKVGAVVQTTSYISKKIIKKINFEQAEIIVEYGSGKGAITKILLEKLSPNAVLFAFETNENFIRELSEIQDSRLIVVNSDAECAKRILKDKYKIEVVDYIISTIPFSLIEKHKRTRIISNSFKLLKETGCFITYQYSLLIYNLLKKIFKQVKWGFVLLNLPPAFIIDGIKMKSN